MAKPKPYEENILNKLSKGEFDGKRASGSYEGTDWEWKIENGEIKKWSKPIGRFFDGKENTPYEGAERKLSTDREKINHFKKFWYKFDIDLSEHFKEKEERSKRKLTRESSFKQNIKIPDPIKSHKEKVKRNSTLSFENLLKGNPFSSDKPRKKSSKNKSSHKATNSLLSSLFSNKKTHKKRSKRKSIFRIKNPLKGISFSKIFRKK